MQTITTKDGIVISGIPDDMSTSDQRLKDMVAQMRATGVKNAVFGVESAAQDQAAPAEEQKAPTLLNRLVPGGMTEVKRNLGAAARGVAGGLASAAGLVVDPITAVANLLAPGKQDYMTLNQSVQTLLSRAGVPEAETEAEKIMQAAVGGMSSGGGGVMLGKGLAKAPGAINAIGNAMAAGPGAQIVGGATSEGSSEIARQQGASPLAQLGIGLGAGLVGGGIAGLKENPVTPGLVSDAQETGIRVLTSDALPPKTFAGKWLQGTGEKIPVTGTGGVRKAQQAERIAAVDDIIRQYGADDLVRTETDVTRDLLSKRSADLGKWAGEKKEVIKRLSSANAGPVDLPRTNAKIDESINYLVSLKSKQNQPVIDLLDDWKQALNGQSLDNVETLRKQIGEAFSAPEMAAVRSTGDKLLTDIYEPLKNDMGDYIKKIGGEADFTKWQVANKELSKMMSELDLPVLKSVLERGEATPEDVGKMLFSSKRSDVATLYRNLSEDGRAAARSAVIAKAAYKAGESLDPDKFATEIGKLGNQVGVLFSGDDLKQLKGLVNVINMTKRASQASLAPPTGVQTAIPIGALGLGALGQSLSPGMPGVLQASGVAASIGLVPRIYESKPVRNILINLSQMKDNTTEAQAMLGNLVTTINAQKQKMEGDTKPVEKERAQYYMPN
jgi:hypothetical protein